MVDDKSVLAVIRAARPSFRNKADKVAFAVHAPFVAAGFVLHAAGPPAAADDALSSACSDEVGVDNWNELDDDYAFLYTNPANSKKVLVKCLAMNDKLLVDALSEDSSEPIHLEINIGDYVTENGGSNYAAQYKNSEQLVKIIDKEILSKIIGTPKESPSTKPSSSRTRDTEDTEPEIQRPQPSPGFDYPPVNPGGFSDLFPGPGAGMYPNRGDFGIGSGGMFVGPDHPLFRGSGRGIDPALPGGLPRGIPPGARFDPYGPPGVPGFEPGRFVRDPRRSGPNHPDLEPFRDDYI
ncbi:probable proteasome inhibitor isoform X1 [Rhododendron vialii]|uniref:probable proteasome inhibitor isoform X1 n=1 Tax=Rhododendron vialii TaxID=182163 RepID=UPI00265F2503|nr:probable proteasome inhibitor isoform X1 [Rhododendron vialii]